MLETSMCLRWCYFYHYHFVKFYYIPICSIFLFEWGVCDVERFFSSIYCCHVTVKGFRWTQWHFRFRAIMSTLSLELQFQWPALPRLVCARITVDAISFCSAQHSYLLLLLLVCFSGGHYRLDQISQRSHVSHNEEPYGIAGARFCR